MVWNNPPMVLYHGTDSRSAADLIANGVDPSIGTISRDFGRGFYLTENLQAASNRAQDRAAAKGPGTSASVLRFEVDRNAFAELDILVFAQPSRMFMDFVGHFRIARAASDGRVSGDRRLPDYDVVVGPVTRLPARPDVFADYDQYCFRSAEAVALLGNVTQVEALPRIWIRARSPVPWH